jgi:ketosteroid isomerase-like protein
MHPPVPSSPSPRTASRSARSLLACGAVLCLVLSVACQRPVADARDTPAPGDPPAAPSESGDTVSRSTGKSSGSAGLGPAALAFDRHGLTPESGFDEILREVAGNERAYAADAAREGMKAASLRWMRADATVFGPEPAPAATVFGAWEEATQPRLAWAPQRVEVSAAGDLAVSTGPYRLESADGAQVRHGHFFSVWQRQADDAWRVVADLSTPVEDALPLPESAWGHRVQLKAPRASVVPEAMPLVTQLEREFSASVAEHGYEGALARYAADDIHLLRAGVPARMGREWLDAETRLAAEDAVESTFVLSGAAAAFSNDFAAGWGVSTDARGFRDAFVRVWRREETRWLVAFDVRVPVVGGE